MTSVLHKVFVVGLYGNLCRLLDNIGLSVVTTLMNDAFNAIDRGIAKFFTSIWDRNFQRRATAPMTVVSKCMVTPDPNTPIVDKNGGITRVAPVEVWLTDESIDYSIFFDYYIDPAQAQVALSRLISKTPIIGGVWTKIDEHHIGIDHRQPVVEFIHAQTDCKPSTDPKDCDEPFYFTKFTNGANHSMPFPEGEHVFRLTLIHYPKPASEQSDDETSWHSLIAVGCSHALCDGQAFFTLLRGWAAEYRGEGDQYSVPEFSRHRLYVDEKDSQPLAQDDIVLGKHVGYSFARHAWFLLSRYPARRWRPRCWTWTKPQLNALKELAFAGRAGEELKKIKRISSNDVLMALYWKLNAVLNSGYESNRPIICSMVINNRRWVPHRFPDAKTDYFGNGLAFLIFHLERGRLIEMDFSEIVLHIRQRVMELKPEDFERDCQFYDQWVRQNSLQYRHIYQGRWAVQGPSYGGFWHSYYAHDRDMMISNLMRLNTHEMDMGAGHPSEVKFNFRDEPTMVNYIFKTSTKSDTFDYYGSFPQDYDDFFQQNDIQSPKFDWAKIQEKYVKFPQPRCCFQFPGARGIRIYPKRDCIDCRKDRKANFGLVEL